MPAPTSARRPAHTGSASRGADGYWRARLKHGDRLFTASSPTSRAEALRRVRAKHAAWLRDGRLVTPADRTTLGAYLDGWLDRVGRERKPSTQTTYRRVLAHLQVGLRALRLAELRPAHTDRAQADLAAAGATAATRAKLHTVLFAALRAAQREEPEAWRNLHTVLTAVRRPRHAAADRSGLDAAQVLALLGRLGEPHRTVAALIAHTGLRAGEVLGLRWGDLSETAGTLRLERQSDHDTRAFAELKHRSQRRTLALHPDAVALLAAHRRQARWRGAGDPLFPGADYAATGLPLHHKTLLRAIGAAARAAGLPAGTGPHALRHAHASLALAAGASAKDVQERLGHANLATTARYLHAAGSGDRTVARRVGDALAEPK